MSWDPSSQCQGRGAGSLQSDCQVSRPNDPWSQARGSDLQSLQSGRGCGMKSGSGSGMESGSGVGWGGMESRVGGGWPLSRGSG